jgi:hypothetical protein
MFEHVAMLLSFIYALAVTHLLASATELIIARDRVKVSGLQAAWMAAALLGLFGNWLQLWPLRAISHWTLTDVTLLMVTAMVQYFTCSLVAVRVEREGPVDMQAFYLRQRPMFLSAFGVLLILAMALNYAERNQSADLASTAWIGEDLLILPFAIPLVVSSLARAAWLQRASVLVFIGLWRAALVLFTPLG